MSHLRLGQIGTKHAHARGKLAALMNHPDVDFAGLWEPDLDQRAHLMQSDEIYRNVKWAASAAELLNDPLLVAIASEGSNAESLEQTEAIVNAGKHVWYDKPAGEEWPHWQRVIAAAEETERIVQMGYMFRYHDGFRRIAKWARSGFLGQIFSIRGHMSTNLSAQQMEQVGKYKGGIFFDLGGHMIDQIVWILGRPHNVSGFMHNHTGVAPQCSDNTLAVLEFDTALAYIDIAAMESRPFARRFEVYGTKGSAILMEPFEPGSQIRLCLDEARDGFQSGEQLVPIDAKPRQDLYTLALDAFLAAIRGKQKIDRSYAHELLVQETLLRATGAI